MRIQSISAPGILPYKRTLVASPDSPVAVTINLQTAQPEAPVPADEKVKGQIAPLLVNGVALTTVYNGGSYLFSQVNNLSSIQLAGDLQKYHLVKDPGMAQDQAKQILSLIQNKGTSAFIIGATAGTLAAVAVDMIRPKWPLSVKLGIGFAIGLAIFSGIYFGLKDKPRPVPAHVARPV